MFKIKTYTIVLIGIFISTLVISTEAFSQSKNVNLENTIEYFNQRNEAVGLVENEKWQEAIPILEKLTQAYQKDGDIFYLLGLSYYQVHQYPNAINALKKILDLGGGTVLTGNPMGSDPSNDIMIQIAKAYSLNGDKTNASTIWD
jgi:tetratricopeptide (TPR) repeat protein